MKFTRLASSALCAALLSAAPASASIIYKFDFTNLTNVQSGTGQRFQHHADLFGLRSDDRHGAHRRSSTAYDTGLLCGLYAGTSSIGWWGLPRRWKCLYR